ncbi:RNA polymerase sigma factor SigM [Nocardia cyriacigeorgica]|uniref:Sigma factor n=2 Tax=Nocardia cyriacigeorgica TaxID=135487 RepID=H6RAU2_NOCCG|nr:RNA polymerase sigma factor SigM [Nocardia cyriacigeorgica]MBF6425121.1 RNA polymerase sigma factor SigM [Nocardia cyriacigeorgica]NEW31413.1 RNA polymerase sigma factor SigM [Nocardia cyriacigeorgica]CCF66303.1 sigma factor [Nocardia cyriacigeorgica GUH-2]
MSSETNAGFRRGRPRVLARGGSLVLGAAGDAELLRAHAAGTPHAFAELLRRHNDHLWQTALRTSYTREDAADSLQDALLSAHRTAGSFRAESEVRSWLHAIVVNACLDRIRRNKTRRAFSLTPENMPEPIEERDEISRMEMSMVVDRALFSLPPDQRTAIVAVDLEGYSVADAAVLLGVPEGTIKSRCARARQRLAERLEFLRDPGNRM